MKLLLSYVYAIGDSKGAHFTNAIQQCEDVIKSTVRTQAELVVAMGNEVIIKWKYGTLSEDQCLQQIRKVEEAKQRLNPEDEAEVRLLKVYAMRKINTDEKGKQMCYEECEQIIQEFEFCNEARLQAVKMLGRLRRSRGQYIPPNDREIEYIEICKTTLPDNPFPFLYDAQANLHRLFIDDPTKQHIQDLPLISRRN